MQTAGRAKQSAQFLFGLLLTGAALVTMFFFPLSTMRYSFYVGVAAVVAGVLLMILSFYHGETQTTLFADKHGEK